MSHTGTGAATRCLGGIFLSVHEKSAVHQQDVTKCSLILFPSLRWESIVLTLTLLSLPAAPSLLWGAQGVSLMR